MSLQGNIAVETYIGELQTFIEKHVLEGKSHTEVLRLMIQKLKDDKATAKAGWL